MLSETDWGALEHAYGTAEDTPSQLVALLHDDQRTRSQAMDHLHYVVHHQGTLYEATVPASLYVAAILPDPRTALPVDKKVSSFPGPMRRELLGWLDSVANAVSDEVEETMRRLGFPPENHLPFVQIRAIRPLLFPAVSAYFSDEDPHVREAALAACIPLLEDPALMGHRESVAPLLRAELATSALWQYQERAVEALTAWGESTADLEIRRDAFEVFNSTSEAPSTGWDSLSDYAEEPPF
ncbi:hypothetical protein [Streptomyces sp. NPDC005012]|uniref:hypothetical protein n=1 Tax=Streptomyces sp. NPDC005012 TaxID=3154558 RepID=UPI0033A64451